MSYCKSIVSKLLDIVYADPYPKADADPHDCILGTADFVLIWSILNCIGIVLEGKQNAVTICPGSSDPIFTVSYKIKWVTTSRTHSITK